MPEIVVLPHADICPEGKTFEANRGMSLLDNGTPNSIGLILLFVGLGYCLLWFFEDRSSAPSRDTPGTRPPGSV